MLFYKKKNYYASPTVPSAWSISKNRRKLQKYNIASFALRSTIKTSGGYPNPSLHCVIPKVAIIISIFRWPLLEPNIFTVYFFWFCIAYLSLWWLAAATRAFLCVNECCRLEKILWVEHCTKIKVFIFEPQTFYGHTSKNYTTVYFYNVFITAYICTGSYLGTVSFHNILYFYQQSNEKVFVKVWKIG